MKKFFAATGLALYFAAVLYAQSAPSNADLQKRLSAIDSLASFPTQDFSAQYTIVHDIPGQGRNTTVAVIFRRDRLSQYLILILKPDADKGKGYLKIGNNLWLYDPAARRFEFTSSKDRFQNSNARNSDFTKSTFALDYKVIGGNRGKLGTLDCWVLSMDATSDDVTFPKVKIWVTDDNLVRKVEDYSLSGQLLRTTATPQYQRVGERFVPTVVYIFDNLKGKVVDGKMQNETTQITIAKPSLQTLPDSVFSQAYLEKVSK